MKRFDDNAFTPTVIPENTTTPFDLNKLLQILPKLNLNSLFKGNNVTANQAPPPAPKLENVLDRQNYIETQRRLNEHYATIKRIRENTNTMQ